MVEVVTITPDFATGPQVVEADFTRLRDAGFAAVLNVRPDDEIGTYLLSHQAEALAREVGLGYAFSPTEGFELFEPEVIDRFERAMIDLEAPIYAHCKSGSRATILWALVAARHRDCEEVIATLRAAGQELDFLEDELHDSAAQSRGSPLRLKDDGLLSLGRSRLLGG